MKLANLANWIVQAAHIPYDTAADAIAEGRVRVDGEVHTDRWVEISHPKRVTLDGVVLAPFAEYGQQDAGL